MSMLGKLGSLFVEITAAGVDRVKSALKDLGGDTQKLATEFDKTGKAGEQMTTATAAGAQTASRSVTSIISPLVAGTTALAIATSQIKDLSAGVVVGAQATSTATVAAVAGVTTAVVLAKGSVAGLQGTGSAALAKLAESAFKTGKSISENVTSSAGNTKGLTVAVAQADEQLGKLQKNGKTFGLEISTSFVDIASRMSALAVLQEQRSQAEAKAQSRSSTPFLGFPALNRLAREVTPKRGEPQVITPQIDKPKDTAIGPSLAPPQVQAPSRLETVIKSLGSAVSALGVGAAATGKALLNMFGDATGFRGTGGLMGGISAAKAGVWNLSVAAKAILPQRWGEEIARGFGSIASAIAPATAVLSGFVSAGVAMSAEGALMSFQMQEISRQVASLFVPQIRLAGEYLGSLVSWFRNLSGEQQRGLRTWGLTAAAITASSIALPRLIGLFSGLTGGVRALSVAMTAAMAHPLLLTIGSIAAGLALVGVVAAKASGAGKPGEALADAGSALADAFGEAKTAASELADLMATGANSAANWLQSMLGIKAAKDEKGQEKTGVSGLYSSLRQRMLELVLPYAPVAMLAAERFNPVLRGADAFLGYNNPLIDRKGAREELPFKPTSGIESAESTWRRIAMASRNVGTLGKTPEQQTAENTGENGPIKRGLGEVKAAVESRPSTVAP